MAISWEKQFQIGLVVLTAIIQIIPTIASILKPSNEAEESDDRDRRRTTA